jgi:hypothetical protein
MTTSAIQWTQEIVEGYGQRPKGRDCQIHRSAAPDFTGQDFESHLVVLLQLNNVRHMGVHHGCAEA